MYLDGECTTKEIVGKGRVNFVFDIVRNIDSTKICVPRINISHVKFIFPTKSHRHHI